MKTVNISYTAYKTFNITDAEYWVVCELIKTGLFIESVKFIRMQYEIGLKEAKDVCDAIRDNLK